MDSKYYTKASNGLNVKFEGNGTGYFNISLDALKALITDDDGPNDYDNGKFGNHVTVDIAFNDNPSSDDFRLVYYVILRGTAAPNTVDPWIYAEAEPDEDDEDDTVSDIVFSKDTDKYLLPNLKGTLERRIDGGHALNITFDTPDFAGGPGDDWNEAAGDLSFIAELWIDGKMVKAVPFTSLGAGNPDTSGDGYIAVTAATGSKATKFEVVGNWVTADDTGGDSPFGDLTVAQSTAEDVEVRISNIIWENIGVKYVDADKPSTVLTPAGSYTETIPYAKSDAAGPTQLSIGPSNTKYTKAGAYEITNAKDVVNNCSATGTVMPVGVSATAIGAADDDWRALTQDWVVIKVKDPDVTPVTTFRIDTDDPNTSEYLIFAGNGSASVSTVDKFGTTAEKAALSGNTDVFWFTQTSTGTLTNGDITGIAPKTQVTLTAHISATGGGAEGSYYTAGGVVGYKFSVDIRDGETKKVVKKVEGVTINNDAKTYNIVFDELTQNLYISPEDVHLVPLKEYTLSTTQTSGFDTVDTITLIFDQKINLDSASVAKIFIRLSSSDAELAKIVSIRTGEGTETGLTNTIVIKLKEIKATTTIAIDLPSTLLSENSTGLLTSANGCITVPVNGGAATATDTTNSV